MMCVCILRYMHIHIVDMYVYSYILYIGIVNEGPSNVIYFPGQTPLPCN